MMVYRILADFVVIAHLLFIVFSLLGGLLVMWRGYWFFVHLPAVVWGVLISFKGWVCPLTPLENQLRSVAGAEGYAGGFVEHYIIPVIYPAGLTLDIQAVMGVVAVGVNVCLYACVLYRRFEIKK